MKTLGLILLAVILAVKPHDLTSSVNKDPLPPPLPPQKELSCLAKNIYHEARGEPYAGQLAVAYTTLNRVEHKAFSNTICAVVFEKGQFSWTSNKQKLKQPIPKKYYELARLAVLQKDRVKFKALYFHATTIKPGWKYKRLTKIGNHIFYA